MQLKVKDMQLKVSMQKNIGERGSRRDICSLSSSLVFCLLSFTHFFLWIRGKYNLSYLYQKHKLFSYLYNPFIQRGISDISYLILPIVTRFL